MNKEIAKRKKNASHVVANIAQAQSSKVANSDDESEDEDDSDDGDDLSEHSSSEEEETEVAGHKSEKVCIYPFLFFHFAHNTTQPKVRTKYDRMFERKNQNILSEHYNKLVDHAGDRPAGDDSDDDFITLKRADHELNEDELPDHDYTSKRKEKMALSKKAIAKGGPRGTKLVFDDEGKPHELYEMKSAQEVFKDQDDVKEAGRQFAEAERGKLKEADLVDRAVAKQKKQEKKRKRKEREREVRRSFFASYMSRLNQICSSRITVTLEHPC